jgi:predicted  nucleic acid-binding Zn-ribbon protein
MVTRAELLSAQSEIKACKEEAAAKAKDFAWIESQVSKGQEQLQAARLEVAQLQATISAMVPRSEFEAAKKQFSEVEASVRAEEQVQRDLVRSLHDRLKALEDEKSVLRTKMQVRALSRPPLPLSPPDPPPHRICARRPNFTLPGIARLSCRSHSPLDSS